MPDETFDIPNLACLFRRGERVGLADSLGATRAADAVHIIFGIRGDIVVDDVGDAGHIDAASGNVGGDHHFIFARFKAFEGFHALRLGAVGV